VKDRSRCQGLQKGESFGGLGSSLGPLWYFRGQVSLEELDLGHRKGLTTTHNRGHRNGLPSQTFWL